MRCARASSATCPVASFSALIRPLRFCCSSLARSAIWLETVRTSPATTEKPRPCSPARSASIMALSARMRMRPVIDWMMRILASVSELTASAASATTPVSARRLSPDDCANAMGAP